MVNRMLLSTSTTAAIRLTIKNAAVQGVLTGMSDTTGPRRSQAGGAFLASAAGCLLGPRTDTGEAGAAMRPCRPHAAFVSVSAAVEVRASIAVSPPSRPRTTPPDRGRFSAAAAWLPGCSGRGHTGKGSGECLGMHVGKAPPQVRSCPPLSNSKARSPSGCALRSHGVASTGGVVARN